MVEFYANVIGLTRLEPGDRGGHRDGIAFFRLGESHAGYAAVLALFADDDNGVSPPPLIGI